MESFNLILALNTRGKCNNARYVGCIVSFGAFVFYTLFPSQCVLFILMYLHNVFVFFKMVLINREHLFVSFLYYD